MSEKLLSKMNSFLANQEVMHIKLLNMHWNLKGKGFFTLHLKLEALYEQSADIIDEVAERILALGGSPVANLKKALELSTVKERPDEPISSSEAIRVLTIDVEWWIKVSKQLIALADEEGDDATSDIFTGYVKEYEKLHWMLKAIAEE